MARNRDDRASTSANATRVRDRATRAESRQHGNCAQGRRSAGNSLKPNPNMVAKANNANANNTATPAGRKTPAQTQAAARNNTQQTQSRKNDTNQNYIRNFPSIMHLINEYPHIRQLLEETAADKDHPIEMFSTHFLSAMLVPEGESLQGSQFVVVNDPWRQEWERGVQVPVNMHSIPQPHFRVGCDRHPDAVLAASNRRASQVAPKQVAPFRLPAKRYLTSSDDGNDNADADVRPSEGARPPAKCAAYDADRLDTAWLSVLNESNMRANCASGGSGLSVDTFERLVEVFESAVNDRLRAAITQQESFFRVQFDQSIVCDVCRSPNAADARGNAMVFCDACNVCVHQLCYGVQRLPAEADSWLCAPCACNLVAPVCALCGYAGGALKPLDHAPAASGNATTGAGAGAGAAESPARSSGARANWAHLSCALWLPEYSVSDPAKMEHIVTVHELPAARKNLCGLCEQQTGVCLTCTHSDCAESFHITCALGRGLQLRTILEEQQVQQLAFCPKHSKATGAGTSTNPSPSPTKRGSSKKTASPASSARTKGNSKRPNSAAYANTKRVILARTFRSRSRSSSTGDQSASESEVDESASAKKRSKVRARARARKPESGPSKRRRVRVIPQATISKCYHELQERVFNIRERFERAANTVLNARVFDTLAKRFGVRAQSVRAAYAYWLLKRRANRGEPLVRSTTVSSSLNVTPNTPGLSPRSPNTLLRPVGTAKPGSKHLVVMNTQTKRSVDLNRLVANARSFIGLRRNLERLRNLCYLVIRRERLRRALAVAQSEIIEQQLTCVPKAPPALWNVTEPATSPSSSASSFVAACAFASPSRDCDSTVAATDLDEFRKLLLNAHIGDSFYENADVLDALELVHEQLCAQQERESWRRVRTEPAVRSEQAAAAKLKRSVANASGSEREVGAKAADSPASSATATATVTVTVAARKTEPAKRARKQQQTPRARPDVTRKRNKAEKVKREATVDAPVKRKRKGTPSRLATKAKRVRVKKENGFNSGEPAGQESEYETASESDSKPGERATRSNSDESDSEGGSTNEQEESDSESASEEADKENQTEDKPSSSATKKSNLANASTLRKRAPQANNAARKAALKKLKISLKVNMRNMQLRPRNGLILRVRPPAKLQS